jgi:hypothetical protein
MNNAVVFLSIMTATITAVTFHAWCLENEKRDVVLLGPISGLFGVGTVAAAVI